MLKTIDFANGSRVLTYAELTEEQKKELEKLMIIAASFNDAYESFTKSIPSGFYSQFYGKYDCLIIRENHKTETNEN